MIHLVRNNSPYTVIILLMFTLLAKLQAISHPQLPAFEDNEVLFSVVTGVFSFFLGGNAFAYTIVAVMMLFAQALYLNSIVNKHRLFSKTTYIPAYLYLLLTSLHPSFSYFSEALIFNWCLIASIDLLLGFHQTHHPRKAIFNAAFIIALLALFHFSAIVYVVLLFAALILLRSFNPGEWVVSILGYLTPFYFWGAILFLTDKTGAVKHWPDISLHLPSKVVSPVYLGVVITGLVVLFFCGLYVLQALMARTSVFARRNWVMVIICLFLSLIVAMLTNIIMQNIWLLVMPALSLIIAHALYLEKNKRFSNFTFYFSLLLLVVCQFVLNS